jgi:hypothetical protein
MTVVKTFARFAVLAACFPFAAPIAAWAAPEAACIDNLVGMNEAVIIDATTLVLHKPGEGYKRITVVNHPLESDDVMLHHPYALCEGDRVAPFGIERGLSVVTEIAGITNAEAEELRRTEFTERIKYKPSARNRLNFLRAGRVGDLCNDVHLTIFQIQKCSEMMQAAQTAEARDDIRETVRYIIKKRQSLANRVGYVNESARSEAFYRWSGQVNAPPPMQPPQR